MEFGLKIAPLVYGGTVLALVLEFLIGRLVPQRAVAEVFDLFRSRRAALTVAVGGSRFR